MQLGNVWLKMNQYGSNILKRDVTPAECVILSHKDGAGFWKDSGGNPLSGLEITGEAKKLTFDSEDMCILAGRYELKENDEGKTEKVFVKETVNRSDAEELSRLKRVYTSKVVEALFPGAAPALPAKFAEVTLPEETVTMRITPVLDPTATKKSEPAAPAAKK